MRPTLRVAAVVLLVYMAGCDAGTSSLMEPPSERAAIQDGRGGEYAGSGVYLLPPVNDNQFTLTAPFDPNADPRVEICELDVQGAVTVASVEAAECASTVAWYETDAASDGVTFVAVEPGQYAVNWKTEAAQANHAFRVSIRLPDLSVSGGAVSVGYKTAAAFDVVLYDNSSTKLDLDRIFGFTAGKNTAIKFVVQEGAGCNGLDCFAYKVGCDAAVYQTEHAGVSMPQDWAVECATDPDMTWFLFQERLPQGAECFPSALFDGIPYEPCYVWQLVTEDDSGDALGFEKYAQYFAEPVLVQFCDNSDAEGGVPELLEPLAGMFRYSLTPTGSHEVALVEGWPEEALTDYSCPYVEGGTTGTSLSFMAPLVRPFMEFMGLAPRAAFADDRNTRTGGTIIMSDFFFGLQLELEAVSTTPTVLAGGTGSLEARLTTPPHQEPLSDPNAGVPGQWLEFQVVAGDATLSATGGQACDTPSPTCVQVPTSLDDYGTTADEGGYATASLHAGSTGGMVEVQVRAVADPDMAPISLFAEVVELEVVFLEPVETGSFSGNPDERFTPTILICQEGVACGMAGGYVDRMDPSDIKLVEERTGRKFYQADWKARDAATSLVGGTYRAWVMVEGAAVGSSVQLYITSGGKSEQTGPDAYSAGENSSVAFKFTITPVL